METIYRRSDEALAAEERIMRDAILDVIDDGCTCDSGEKHPWELDGLGEKEQDIENAQRLRFADAVIARARRIKQVDDTEIWYQEKQ